VNHISHEVLLNVRSDVLLNLNESAPDLVSFHNSLETETSRFPSVMQRKFDHMRNEKRSKKKIRKEGTKPLYLNFFDRYERCQAFSFPPFFRWASFCAAPSQTRSETPPRVHPAPLALLYPHPPPLLAFPPESPHLYSLLYCAPHQAHVVIRRKPPAKDVSFNFLRPQN